MKDFTLDTYNELLSVLIQYNYQFVTFDDYCNGNRKFEKTIILRHDIDRISSSMTLMAELESKKKINASYYFPHKHFKHSELEIRKIEELNHEVGYHYNEVTKHKGDLEKAYKNFVQNLLSLRKIVAVTTISMDGQPLSKFDNRTLWSKHNYKELDLLGEIYLDVDYNEFAYYSDTGRKWNNFQINFKDKVNTQKTRPSYDSTKKIIQGIIDGSFPNKVVLNIHPEHWTSVPTTWLIKLAWQSVKNVAKYFLLKIRKWS